MSSVSMDFASLPLGLMAMLLGCGGWGLGCGEFGCGAAMEESEYRGFSTALRSGRNDSIWGGVKESQYRGFSTALRSGRNDSILEWGGGEPIQGFLHCAPLRSK